MKWKIFLVLFICFLRCFSDTVVVSNAKELLQLFQNVTGDVVRVNITLAADIDFSGLVFPPLGVTTQGRCIPYSGVFDGKGHSLENLIMDRTDYPDYQNAALFCSVCDSLVQNIVFRNSCTFSGASASSLTETVSQGNLTVNNVTNEAVVTGKDIASAFVTSFSGTKIQMLVFENCSNEGQITTQGMIAGGIIGEVSNTVNASVSFNNIILGGSINGRGLNDHCHLGGFVGVIAKNTGLFLTINNAENNAMIQEASVNSCVGGFVGTITNNENVYLTIHHSKSQNIISVSAGLNTVGGVFGFVTDNRNMNIFIKNNSGIVRMDMDNTQGNGNAGGYVGLFSNNVDTSMVMSENKQTANLELSNKNGQLMAGLYFGAVFNENRFSCSFRSESSKGIVNNTGTDNVFVGGLIGDINKTTGLFFEMNNCTNDAHVISINTNGDSFIGSLIGRLSESLDITMTMEKDIILGYHSATSSRTSFISGLIGLIVGNNNISMSTNEIICETIIKLTNRGSDSYVGGFIGEVSHTHLGVFSLNNVLTNFSVNSVNTGSDNYIGGYIGEVFDNSDIVLNFSSSVTNGTISGTNKNDNNHAGGFVGSFFGNQNMVLLLENCQSNSSIVTQSSNGDNYAGGFIGAIQRNHGMLVNASNCTNNGIVNSTTTGRNFYCYVAGFVGWVHTDDTSSKTGFFFRNTVNLGTISGLNGYACGFFCAYSCGIDVSSTVTNSINNGTVIGKYSFGISNVVSNIRNVVNIGLVKGTQTADPLLQYYQGMHESLFYMENSCSSSSGNCTNDAEATMFFQNSKNGVFFTVDGQRVDDLLNDIAFEQSYLSLWSSTLHFSPTLTLSVGSPVNKTLDLSTRHKLVDVLQELSPHMDFRLFVVVDQQTEQSIKLSDNVLHSFTAELYHNVTLHGSSSFWLVTHGSPLGEIKGVEQFFHGYHVVEFRDLDQLVLNSSFPVYRNTELWLCFLAKVSGAMELTTFVERGQNLSTNSFFECSLLFDDKFELRDLRTSKLYHSDDKLVSDIDVILVDCCEKGKHKKCHHQAQWNTEQNICQFLNQSSEGHSTSLWFVIGGVVFAFCTVGVLLVLVLLKRGNTFYGSRYSLIKTSVVTPSESGTSFALSVNSKTLCVHLSDEIGRGSFATVWKAETTDGTVIAVKLLDDKKYSVELNAINEAEIMKPLDTQFVAAVYGCSRVNRKLAIAMELFPLGSLMEVLQNNKLQTVSARLNILLDTAKAMDYLHTMGIIHRDLKPGNVLVCSIDPLVHPMCKFVINIFHFFISLSVTKFFFFFRISDFGEARSVESMEASMTMTSGVGTPFYMAPEMAQGFKHYTGAVDVFSFGIMSAQVMVGRLVYDTDVDFSTQYSLSRFKDSIVSFFFCFDAFFLF